MGYLRRRFLQAIVSFWGIITITFVFVRLIPGGPEDYLLSQILAQPGLYGLPPNPTLEQINEVLHSRMNFRPDMPMWKRYLKYMEGVILHANLGTSLIVDPGVPNATLILRRAPWTIFLSSVGFVYSLVAGIVFGSMMAWKEGTKFDIGMTTWIIFSGAVPYYIFAILLLSLFAWDLGWLPAGGRWNTDTTPGFNWPFIAGVIRHAVLPIASTILLGFAGSALGLRANAIRELGSSYLRNAQLRGLSNYTLATRYLARNAILPMYTGIVLGIGTIIGGNVILEQIFRYPGMGLLAFNAATQQDYPLLMATAIIGSGLFILGTLLADFTYSLIDPRVDLSSMEES